MSFIGQRPYGFWDLFLEKKSLKGGPCFEEAQRLEDFCGLDVLKNCPAWIRTMTLASKGRCATITQQGKRLKNEGL